MGTLEVHNLAPVQAPSGGYQPAGADCCGGPLQSDPDAVALRVDRRSPSRTGQQLTEARSRRVPRSISFALLRLFPIHRNSVHARRNTHKDSDDDLHDLVRQAIRASLQQRVEGLERRVGLTAPAAAMRGAPKVHGPLQQARGLAARARCCSRPPTWITSGRTCHYTWKSSSTKRTHQCGSCGPPQYGPGERLAKPY